MRTLAACKKASLKNKCSYYKSIAYTKHKTRQVTAMCDVSGLIYQSNEKR